MIYEINSLNSYEAVQSGAKFIINSADGSHALVLAETLPETINILATHEEASLPTLMNSIEWKQPCIGC
jgi:hypothetical protein